MVGVPFGVAPVVAVLRGVVLALAVGVLPGVVLEPVPHAVRVGIRKSITKRLVPVNARLEDIRGFCIRMCPLLDQDILYNFDEFCETDHFYRE